MRERCGCGHQVYCDACVWTLVEKRGPLCTYCREPYECELARSYAQMNGDIVLMADAIADVMSKHSHEGGFMPAATMSMPTILMSVLYSGFMSDVEEALECMDTNSAVRERVLDMIVEVIELHTDGVGGDTHVLLSPSTMSLFGARLNAKLCPSAPGQP